MDRRTAVKNMALSLGFIVSGSTIINIFNACSTDQKAIKPNFFKASDLYSINFLTDIILPTTTSIGAKDLNLTEFIDTLCADVLTPDQQRNMRFGAEEFSNGFYKLTGKETSHGNQQDYQRMLAACFDVSEADQQEIFKLLKQDVNTLSKNLKSKYYLYAFLTTIRELTLLGYFTSKTITEPHV